MMGHKLLSNILIVLGVKHTDSFVRKIYMEHPDKDNMYGFASLLSSFGVKTLGIKVGDKTEVFKMPCPFIAQIGDTFMLVRKVTPEIIDCMDSSGHIEYPYSWFFDSWNGIALLIEPESEASEPDYKAHKKQEWVQRVKVIAIIIPSLVIVVLSLMRSLPTCSFSVLLYISLQIVGLFICSLLLAKQVKVDNKFADKICSLFDKKGCNSILSSEAAKVLWDISWSEIGFGIFFSNIILLLINPYCISEIALFNIVALPISLWSIWYQKVVAKQWCTLCLFVQGVIVISFICAILSHFLQNQLSLMKVIITGSTYIILILLTHFLAKLIQIIKKKERDTYLLNRIKYTEGVFSSVLNNQPSFNSGVGYTHLVFGNPDSSIKITIFSNPHCNPCAEMHKRIERLMEQSSDSICVRYILTYFNETLSESNRFLIATYLEKGESTAFSIFHKWFWIDNKDRNKLIQDNPVNLQDVRVNEEMKKHRIWRDQCGFHTTPTILINGYLLPNIYTIEDISKVKV